MLSGMLLSITPLLLFVPPLSEVKQRDPFINRDCLTYIEKFKGCSKAKRARCKLKTICCCTEFSVTKERLTSELCMQVSLKFFPSV